MQTHALYPAELNYQRGCACIGTHAHIHPHTLSLFLCLSPKRDSLQASHNCLIRRVCEVQMPRCVSMPRINYRIRLIPVHVWRAYIPYRHTVATNVSAANNRELHFPYLTTCSRPYNSALCNFSNLVLPRDTMPIILYPQTRLCVLPRRYSQSTSHVNHPPLIFERN